MLTMIASIVIGYYVIIISFSLFVGLLEFILDIVDGI